MSKKQSALERLDRLAEGRCPVHGLWMPQIDRWYYPADGKPYTFVGCPRKDCLIYAKAYDFSGPWELPDEFANLLNDDVPDPVYISSRVTKNDFPKRKSLSRQERQKVWEKTNGRCYYCGKKITFSTMTIDHFIPISQNGKNSLDNLVPACRSCNSSKRDRSIDEFRFLMQMKEFESIYGVTFTRQQIDFLADLGINLPISNYVFWFEKH